MDKTIEPVNFTASQDLSVRIEEIFDKLDKFHDKIIKADIYLKDLKETPTGNKKVEVRLFLPGNDIYVEQEAESFISAAQQVFDKLKIMLKKEKEKAKSY